MSEFLPLLDPISNCPKARFNFSCCSEEPRHHSSRRWSFNPRKESQNIEGTERRRTIRGEGSFDSFTSVDCPFRLNSFCRRLPCTVKANMAVDLPSDQRISDTDILHNINTFMFAGSDTSSLSLTWTLLLLAQNPSIQDRLRAELFSVAPTSSGSLSHLTEDEIHSLYTIISNLPYLDNVTRESLRLIPPVHSSIRVATQDDEVPVSYPVHNRNGEAIKHKSTITIPKGTLIHVAVEGFNLDKKFWGEDAWEFV